MPCPVSEYVTKVPEQNDNDIYINKRQLVGTDIQAMPQ